MMMEVSIHFSELGRPDRFTEMNSIPIHCCKFLGKFLLLLLRVPTKCWASKNAAVFMSFPRLDHPQDRRRRQPYIYIFFLSLLCQPSSGGINFESTRSVNLYSVDICNWTILYYKIVIMNNNYKCGSFFGFRVV